MSSKVVLDLKKFKHIKSDKDTTTLRHADGHELKIAHNSMSPEFQKQLSALSKISSQDKTPLQADETKHQGKPAPQVSPNPSSAPSAMFYDGGPTPSPSPVPSKTQEPDPDKAQKAMDDINKGEDLSKTWSNIKTGMGFADGGAVNDVNAQTEAREMKANLPPVDSSIQAKKDLYNQLVASGGAATSPADMFGPNGEVPANPVNPTLWGQIENSPHLVQLISQQQADRKQQTRSAPAAEQQAVHDQALPQNVVNAKIGAPMVPDPGAPNQAMQPSKEVPVIPPKKTYAKGGNIQEYAEGTNDVTPLKNASQINNNDDTVPEKNPPYAAANVPLASPTELNLNQPLQTPASSEPPAVNPNDYATIYDRIYKQTLKSGASESQARTFALNMAENQRTSNEKSAQSDITAKDSLRNSILEENKRRQSLGISPLEVPAGGTPEAPAAQPQAMDQTQAPQQPPPAGSSPDAFDKYSSSLNAAKSQELKGIQAQSQALQGQAQLQQQAYVDDQKSRQTAQTNFQNEYNNLENERQNHVKDIENNFIDPDQYWKGDAQGNGGHSKLAAAIGMIIAGFNPTSKPNAAVDFLKFQIDKNMEAQAKNLDARGNLLRANIQQFGNNRDAVDMTRLMLNDDLTRRLDQKSNQLAASGKGLQAGILQQKKGELMRAYAPLQMEMALRKSMINIANSGNSQDEGALNHTIGMLRVMNPEMAKEMESRRVPGIGIGSIPVPDAARQQLIAHQKLDSIGNDVLSYAQSHTNLVPGTAEYNTGVQKSMILQQAIREGLLGTVFRESEKPLLQKFVDDNPAGAFKTLSSEPKIKTILDSNRMQGNILKSNYGLPVKNQPQAQQPQIVTGKDGKQYRREGNYMVPVK
jgi:hypothetical protein